MIRRRTLLRAAPAALALPYVAPPALAQGMNLRMQHFLGTNSALHRVTTQMAEEVKQATGGRVQLQVLPGGAMFRSVDLRDRWFTEGEGGCPGPRALWPLRPALCRPVLLAGRAHPLSPRAERRR
jgi:hypothetical protein